MSSYGEMSLKELFNAKVLQTIVFPLVVPASQEIKKFDFSKSDLNACYSKPPINSRNGQEQSWFEVKLTVVGEHNLPPRKEWFYVVMEDGNIFKAHFSGKKTKKLVTFEDTSLIGHCIKSMFFDRRLVKDFEYCFDDPYKYGVITKEMLDSYGSAEVILKKTNKTKTDGKGNKRDIWIFSFPLKPDLLDEEWREEY